MATDESDLRHFLKVVRPDWSCPRRKGHSDIQRVIKKLQDIGVHDTFELMHRVNDNRINEDLSAVGHNRFSKDTVESMRKQAPFIRALEHLKEPYYRQVGLFAPVPQLLTGTNLRHKAEKRNRVGGLESPTSASSTGSRPATSDGSGGGMGGLLRRPHEELAVRPHSVGSVGFYSDRASSSGCDLSGLFDAAEEDDSSMISESNLSRKIRLKNAKKKRPARTRSLTNLSPEELQEFEGATSLQDLLATGGSPLSMDSGLAFERPASQGSSPDRVASPDRLRNSAVSWNFSPDDDAVEDMMLSKRRQAPAPDFAQKWAKLGDRMKQEPWVAKWGSASSAVLGGKAMLREQSALDERKVISRAMTESSMRSHVTSKIRCRLHEERERDAQGVLDVGQSCINIRKNLGLLATSRRDLSETKRRAQDAIEGRRLKAPETVQLSLRCSDE